MKRQIRVILFISPKISSMKVTIRQTWYIDSSVRVLPQLQPLLDVSAQQVPDLLIVDLQV